VRHLYGRSGNVSWTENHPEDDAVALLYNVPMSGVDGASSRALDFFGSWFRLDTEIPNHSVLSKARRAGARRFPETFHSDAPAVREGRLVNGSLCISTARL